MTHFLRQLFRIEPGEGLKVAQFAALGLLLQAGLALGISAADSIFLVNIGPDKLPHIYLLTPVVMMLYIPAYSALLGRWGIERVFDLTLAILVAGGATLWFAFHRAEGGNPVLLCYAAKLYAALWFVGIYTLFWNFIDSYVDLLDAKRFFALFAAGSALGAIIGGSLVGPLSSRYGVEPLFLAWSATALAAWPLALWIRRSLRPLETEEAEHDDSVSAAAQAGLTVRRLLGSRYATVLTLLLFLTLVAATICEYQYLGVFSSGLDEAGLAGLLGRLTAMVNVFNLALTLFFFNKLVNRFGVRNVALIQPVVFALVFTWLLLDRGFLSAVAGFVAYQGIMTAIEYNNVNLLFSGLPADRRKQIRTLIEGLGEPLATATAGVFLFFAGSRLSPEQVSMSGIAAAFACLGCVFIIRSDYAAAIAANLRRDWLDFSRRPDPVLRDAPPTDITLAARRAASDDPAEAAFAVRFLWLNAPAQAASALMALLQHPSAAHRALARPLLDEMLADPGAPAAQEIHRWLDQNPDIPDVELAGDLGRHRLLPSHQARALLAAGDPRARAAGAVMLWQSWRIDDNAGALDQIKRLLGSADPREVVAGLQSLGRLGEPKYAYLLRDFLGDSDSSVRAAALHAVSGLASSAGSSLLPELTVVIEHGGPEDRRLAFEAIERIGDSSVIETLLLRANAYTPAERRRIERLILEFGPRTVPLLTTIAQSPRFPVAARCVALRAIGKLSFPQVESLARPLIATTLSRAYLFLGSYLALARGDVGETGRAVLTRIYRDFPTLAIEIVLETLTIAGRLPGYEGPLAALQGGLSKERGYAIETIEQACDRKLFNLLLPLIDGRSLEAQVEFALSHELLPELDADAVLSRSLASEFPLEAAATVQALHAMAPDRNGDSLIAKLRQFPHPMLRTTILTLLARQAGEPAGLTPVEIVRELMAMPAMAGALFLHHEALVGQVRLVQPADGTRLFTAGGPADGLWQVLAGEVRTQDPDARHGAGATLGLADFYAGGPCRQTAVAAGPGTRLLHIPAEALRRCIEIHPAFGLALLRHKLTA